MAEANEDSEADNTCSETITWVQLATNIQQRFCELFKGRPWEPVDTTPCCLENLERNIGYSLFGPPPQLPGDDPDTVSGYDDTQLKKIRKIYPTIVRLISTKPKSIMFLFFGIKQKEEHKTVPVFRVVEGDTPDAKEDCFVDHKGRVYKGWEDIVKNNLFPNSLICCPKSGLYTQTDGKVDVEFIQPSSTSCPRRVFDALNLTTAIATTSVGVATLLIAVPGSIILAATIAGVVSGCYGLGYSVNNLVDRSLHGQTLSLKSSEARNNWLGVIGSTAGIALGGIDAVRSALLPGNSNCLRILTSLNIGCSAVKGLSVINGFANVINNARSTGKITPLDAYQLSASVLFFGGSLISMENASTALQRIIKFDLQKVTDVIGTIEKMDGVIKTAIPKTDDIPTQSEREKTEKKEYREVDKIKLQNLPDLITEEIEGIKIINIDNHLFGDEPYNETLGINNKPIEQGKVEPNQPVIKLIKLLSSPSLKIYQVDNEALPTTKGIGNEAITLLQVGEQSSDFDDSSKSNRVASSGSETKGTFRGVKNMLAAIRILEVPKKGTYTLNTDIETGTTQEVNGDTNSKNSQPEMTQDAEKNADNSENDILRTLLEKAKTKQSEEESTYHEKKSKALTYKPKLNQILMLNRFWNRYKPEKSNKHTTTVEQSFSQQSPDEPPNNVSDENKQSPDELPNNVSDENKQSPDELPNNVSDENKQLSDVPHASEN